MLLERVKVPWKIGFALLVASAPWWPGEEITPRRPMCSQEFVEVHIKLAAENLHVQGLSHDSPLFTSLTANEHDDRARWRLVFWPADNVEQRLAALAADPAVEQAFVAPEVTLPTSEAPGDDGESCPIHTPSFESYQGYLGPAPGGIDAPAAWRRGARGAGVWFADLEGGWNAAHEDLPGERIEHVVGESVNDPSWRAHGTAVLGEVVGRDNGKGVVGIAPDVERVFTASIFGTSVADALDRAARKLRPGDVLLIELQGAGPRGRWLPMEYWDDIYDVIAAATKRGVVIIEAAGNGAEDLDHSAYNRKFDRKKRDSGAIMIGAGGPPRDGFTDRARLDFSNYGGRVDVQGWGRKVATLEYGDLQACTGEERSYTDRHYTGEFSGTSSASPIVAGAAVLLEGIARERGRVLPPRELRELLRSTGTPQAGDLKKQIGPRPDLARAIAKLP
ncbi:MAG: S8 family peptidase [Kofleriaceae bacterium]